MAAADRAQLIAELTLDDKFTRPLARIDKRLGAFSGAVNRNLARGIDSAASAVARGVVNIGKSVATAAIDWQDAFQGVIKTVDATPAQFDDISDALRKMSTEMPNTALELADIAAAGGAMGIKAKDIESFTRQVAILASTTNVSADDAATALGQLQNVIGLTGDEFDNFTAALVDLGNKGSSTEDQILEIERRAGGAAKLIGLAKSATLGWSAAAANLGLQPELAGTALQNFYLKTQSVVSNGGKKLRTFAKIAGMTAKDFAKAFRKDASGSLERFVKGLKGMSKGDQLKAVQKFFGKGSGLTRLILGLAASVDKNLTPALDDSTRAWNEGTAAQAEFEKRNATVKSAFARLKNTAFDAAVTVGEGFAPALGRAADKLSDFLKVPENRQSLKDLGQDIGKIIDNIDWDGLIKDAKAFMGALEKAGGFARGLWDAFSAMPEDAKAVLLSLAGLNKITGGAVSGIVGELSKGLIKGVLSMNAGVVNINAAVVNGGGGKNPVDTVVDTAGKVGIVEAIRQSIGRLLKPGGLIGGGGAAVSLDMVQAQQEAAAALTKIAAREGRSFGGGGSKPSNYINPFGPGPVNQGGQMKGWADGGKAWTDTGKKITDLQHNAVEAINAKGDATVDAQGQAKREITAKVGAGATQTSNATTGGASRITSQGIANTSRIVGTIQANRPIVTTSVVVNVTAAQVTKSVTTQTRYGRSGGSAAQDDPNGAGR